jgi:hypothetical protein
MTADFPPHRIVRGTVEAEITTGLTFDVNLAGVQKLSFTPSTGQLALPVTGSGAGLLIGGDVQLYRSAANTLLIPDNIEVTGTLYMTNAAGSTLLNEAAAGDNPTLVPNRADTHTGIGWNANDQLSLIAGAVELMRLTEGGTSGDMVEIFGGAASSGGVDDKTVNITATLNDTGAAGGSDLFNLIKGNLTITNATGWDTVNLIDLHVGGASKFTVDYLGGLKISSDLLVPENIRHKGDSDTRIQFGTDQIDIEVGGVTFVTFDEDTNDVVTWGSVTHTGLALSGSLDFNGFYIQDVERIYQSGTPADSGFIRIENNNAIAWRSAGDTTDATLVVTSNNDLTFTYPVDLARFIVRSGVSDAIIEVDSGDDGAAEASLIYFSQDRTVKWQIGKTVSDTFFIYDDINDQTVLLLDAAAATVVATWSNVTHTGFKLPNATWITARNAADSADVNVISLDASNFIAFGAETLLATTNRAYFRDSTTYLYSQSTTNLTIYADAQVNLDAVNLQFADGAKITMGNSLDSYMRYNAANTWELFVGAAKAIEAGSGTIGFLQTTPQAQQAHIVDADGTIGDITTKFNTLLADLEGYGLLAAA